MITYLLNPSGGVYRFHNEIGLEFFILDTLSWHPLTKPEFDFVNGWLDPVDLNYLPEQVQQVEGQSYRP